MTVDTKDLVTTIAYLIGVRKHTLEQCFDAECHDTLQKLYGSKEATVIHRLGQAVPVHQYSCGAYRGRACDRPQFPCGYYDDGRRLQVLL